MFDYLIKRPMLFCGIICSVIAVVGYHISITLLLFGIITAILLGVAFLKPENPSYILVLILIFIMIISSVNAYSFVGKTEKYNGETRCFEFVVKESENKGEYTKALIEIKGGADTLYGQNAEIIYYGADLKVGNYYNGNIKLRKTEDRYKLINYSQNVFLSGILKDASLVKGKEDGILVAIETVRDYIKETLFRYLGYDEASTLCALLFGERGFFDSDFGDNINRAGVSHVMVVSGMHFAVIVGFFTKFMNHALYNRFVKALAILAVVLMLTAVCGFTMSIQRAGINYLLIAFSLIINRKSTPSNTLGTAVTLILIISPFAIFSVAFQLSVLSTFGILAVALPVSDYMEQNDIIKNPIVFFFFDLILLSLSALLFTLPVAIYVFGYISVVAVISNILISNVVTIALCVGVTAILTSLVSDSLTAIIFIPCHGMLKYINSVINTLGEWKYSYLSINKGWSLCVIFLIILLFWLLVACKKRQDVLKLEKLRTKITKESGRKSKWQ